MGIRKGTIDRCEDFLRYVLVSYSRGEGRSWQDLVRGSGAGATLKVVGLSGGFFKLGDNDTLVPTYLKVDRALGRKLAQAQYDYNEAKRRLREERNVSVRDVVTSVDGCIDEESGDSLRQSEGGLMAIFVTVDGDGGYHLELEVDSRFSYWELLGLIEKVKYDFLEKVNGKVIEKG